MSTEWSGVALPWGPSIKSFIEPKDDTDILKTSVLFILMTRLGERVMRPDFGSLLPDAVFEQNDDVLQAELSASVEDAIATWDDRIELVEFLATRDVQNPNNLDIKIVWKNAKDPFEDAIQTLEYTLTPSLLS